MRELTIAQCKQLEKGEAIPSFRGRITKVYKQNRGIGEYGEWTIQNMIVTDDTGQVQVTWGGEDDLSELEGQARLFESNVSDKHGFTGIKWDVRTSNGKRYEGIKLTASCKIKPVDGGDATCVSPVTPIETSKPALTSNPESAGGGEIHNGVVGQIGGIDGITEARQHAMRVANLMLIEMNTAKYVAEQWRARHGYELPNEHFQALCASFFIEASSRRTMDGVNWWSYIDKMPAKPISKMQSHDSEADSITEPDSEVPF